MKHKCKYFKDIITYCKYFFFSSLINFQTEITCFFLLLHNHNTLVERGSLAKFSEIPESTRIVVIVSFKQLMVQLVTRVRAFKMHVRFYPAPLK